MVDYSISSSLTESQSEEAYYACLHGMTINKGKQLMRRLVENMMLCLAALRHIRK